MEARKVHGMKAYWVDASRDGMECFDLGFNLIYYAPSSCAFFIYYSINLFDGQSYARGGPSDGRTTERRKE